MKAHFDAEIKHIIQELLLAFDFRVYGIYYLGEVEKDKLSYSSFFYFKQKEDTPPMDAYSLVKEFGVSDQVFDEHLDRINSALIELYDAFCNEGQPPWDAIEIVYQDNKASGKLKYNWLENERTPIERRIIWAYESLGIKPDENSYSARLLKEYIDSKGSENQ